MKLNKILDQKQVPILGAINQVIGGAIGWFGTMTFITSSIAAWNTPTMDIVRERLPWLNIVLFVLIMMGIVVLACLIQHKWIQPSAVNYWRRMFYDDNPYERRQKALAEIILGMIQDPDERLKARRLLEEAEKPGETR